MDDLILSKIIDFLVAVAMAPIATLTLGYVAHYLLGMSRLDIRTSALIGVAVTPIVALLLVTEWFKKLRKSK